MNIAWQAASWNGYGGTETTRSRLFSWNEASLIVRTVHDAFWDQPNCDGGEFNLNVSNPQLSECDFKLYLTFSQFNDIPNGVDDDCASRAPGDPTGAANGEIMVAVSTNAGFNWDLARNLTQTYTPGCDSAGGGGLCGSEVWHSATRYGIDITNDDFSGIPDVTANIDGGYAAPNYLFVEYVSDDNAGAAISGEGVWTLNPVKVFRFGCVDDVSLAVLASSLPRGQAIDSTTTITTGVDSTISWRLENIGNISLTYSISIVNDIPSGNVTVTGGTGTIGAGLTNFENLDLKLNAGLETTPQSASATIIVDGNFASAPDTFQFDYQIVGNEVSDFRFKQQSFLDTGSTVVYENTHWGLFSFEIVPTKGDTVRYLNVSAAIGADTGWIVRNYPILPETYIDTGRFAIDFDFGELGISDSTLVTTLDYVYQVTDGLLFTGPIGTFITALVSELNVMTFGAELETTGDPFLGPGILSPAYFLAAVNLDSLRKYRGLSHNSVPSVQEDPGECNSGATARSLKWLSNEHDLGLGTAQSIQEELDDADLMPAPGITLTQMMAAKNKYIEDNNLPLEVHYWYSDSIYGAHPDWRDTPGASSESSSDIDMIDWIWREMEKGQDIEVAFLWDNTGSGHCVTLVGVDKLNDKIEFRDDETQGVDSTGDDAIKEAQLVPLGGGEYGFRAGANRILYLAAESPAFDVWDCVHSSQSGTYFSPSLWTLDGEAIGETFPDGVTPLPCVETYGSTTLPARPNDWHWYVDFLWNEIPVTVFVWFFNFQPTDILSFDIYCPGITDIFPPGFMFIIDVGEDSYIISDSLETVIHSGVWSLYPGDLPPGYDSVGAQRTNQEPETCCIVPGDADGGGDVNIGDAIFIVKYAFVEGSPTPPCCDQADADGGGDINIGDAIYIVKFAFVEDSPVPVCNPDGVDCQ